MSQHAIVTPIWRAELTPSESDFIEISSSSNASIDKWFCAPESLNVSNYADAFPEWQVKRFPDEAFTSVRSYSYWLTSPTFYQSFSDYEFVTICQTDAVLIAGVDEIDMDGVDYVGAVWDPPLKVITPGNRVYVASDFDGPSGWWLIRKFGRSLFVGNGGLSTRRVTSHIAVTEWLTRYVNEKYRLHTLEDALLCSLGPKAGLRIASKEMAGTRYLESRASALESIPPVIGFHGLQRWNPNLAEMIRRTHLGSGDSE